jgi:uncharacterized protein (TIGR02284 family)
MPPGNGEASPTLHHMGPSGTEESMALAVESSAGTSRYAYNGASKNAIEALSNLNALCHDSVRGFRRAAEDSQDLVLRDEFERLADERRELARELDRCMRELGEEPENGTTAGKAHRLWLDVKSCLSGGGREAVVREVVRGESTLEEAYDVALRSGLPQSTREVVARQHKSIRQSRDRFRNMLPNDSIDVNRMGKRINQAISSRPLLYTVGAIALGAAIAGAIRAFWLRR